MGVCGTPWQIVDIQTVWERIAPRIPAGSEPAEILAACADGEAVCLESPDGVLVITLTPDAESLEFALFVLLAVGYIPGAFQRRAPDLDTLAADLGASSIAWCPRRRGWDRLARQRWIRQGDTFTREVNHHGRQRRSNEADPAAARAG